MRWSVLIVVVLPVTLALGAEHTAQDAKPFRAVRTSERLSTDGVLDEPAWQQAIPFKDFIEVFPLESDAPSEPTEVRVLYDEQNLYIGITCHDSQPEQIVHPFGRRDQFPSSDWIKVLIDSAHTHQGAFSFRVNAGGILADELIYADSQFAAEWDAVWDAAVQLHPGGWSVELVIPLGILPRDDESPGTWGFAVQRYNVRTREKVSSSLIPHNSNVLASRLGHLVGVELSSSRPGVELVPYLVSRVVAAPLSLSSQPGPRQVAPSFDLGLDLSSPVGRNLTLNATVNPDFGQVEVDRRVLNLSNVELFLPEKRPFFLQGMNLFQTVGTQGGLSPQMLFYSRRMGLSTPILAAAKLTGSVSPRLDIGLLNVIVTGAASDPEQASGGGLRFHPERPLHLGLDSELPTLKPVPLNYFAAVAQGRLDSHSTVGGRFVAATPLSSACTPEDLELAPDVRPMRCTTGGGNAAALDWNLRTADAQWGVLGQLTGSQVVGGSPSRLLRDGTVLERGALGLGGFVQAGKLGGEPWRFDVGYRYAAPTLELNSVGYLPTQNEQFASASARYVRPTGAWGLYGFSAELTANGQWTADARIRRERNLYLDVSAFFSNLYSAGVRVGLLDPGYDVREIPGTGVALQRPIEHYVVLFGETDTSRQLSLSASAKLLRRALPQQDQSGVGWAADLGVTWRPLERLQTELILGTEDMAFGPRYVRTQAPGQYLFGDLDARYLSAIFRQQLVITPRLTLAAYAQLFTDQGRFQRLYEASSSDGAPLSLADLSPSDTPGGFGFHHAAMNLSAVLRWEYKLGSLLYVVYTRAQFAAPAGDRPVPVTLEPVGLFAGPATDVFLVKWSYWWNTL